MKIVMVTPGLTGGGAEFVSAQWANYLVKMGHEVVVFTSQIRDDWSDVPFRVEHCSAGSKKKFVVTLAKLNRKFKPSVCLSFLPFYNLAAILAVLLVKPIGIHSRVVISGRNMEVPFPEVHGGRVRMTALLSKILYPNSARFVAISHPVAAEALALYRLRPENVIVVPNPALGKVGLKDGVCVRRIDPSGPVRICVPGRLVEQKSPLIALEVAELLTARGLSVSVVFFGDGPLREELLVEASARGMNCEFAGWAEHWFDSLRENDVVLLPSRVEGFGNVLVESAAAGVPAVVSSSALGVADAVLPGVTGAIVPTRSVESFANGILQCSDLEEVPVTNWLKRFAVDSSGALIESVLADAVDGGSVCRL